MLVDSLGVVGFMTCWFIAAKSVEGFGTPSVGI